MYIHSGLPGHMKQGCSQLRDEGPDALREVANLSCNVTTPNVEINLTTACNEKLYIKKGRTQCKSSHTRWETIIEMKFNKQIKMSDEISENITL